MSSSIFDRFKAKKENITSLGKSGFNVSYSPHKIKEAKGSYIGKAELSPFYAISWKLFSRFVQSRNFKSSGTLQNSLKKASINVRSEEFLAASLFTSIIVAGIALIFLLISLIMKFFYAIDAILIIAVPLSAWITYVVMISYPESKASSRKKLIESNLGGAMAFIAAMASADVPVDVIFKELSKRDEYGEIRKEALKITRNTELFGMDIFTAIGEASRVSPSIKWQEFLQGVVTTATTGGRLKPYFVNKAEEYQNELRIALRKNAENVGLFAETYVTVGVAFPLFLIVILAIMGVISGSSGSSTIVILAAFSFLVMPVIIGTFIWIMGSVSKEVSI